MTASLSPDVDAARAFLRRFDPAAGLFTIQTFDDSDDGCRELAQIRHIDPANGALYRVARINRDRSAGVFFAVNATDGKGRNTRNIVRVRAVFLDLDGAPLEPVLAAGLSPHFVVESSPGKYHVYWRTDDCPRDLFERVQLALARRFNGDQKVHDLPRVLRVPGFLHHKGSPFRCRELEGVGFDGPPYAIAEIVRTLGLEFGAPPGRSHTSGLQDAPNGPQSDDRPAQGTNPRPEDLEAAVTAPDDDSPTFESLVDASKLAELRDALTYISADDRDVWIAVGHALKPLGEPGRALWEEWSRTSAKWQPGDARTWDGFKPDRTGYAAVFKRAQANGWQNPRSRTVAGEAHVEAGALTEDAMALAFVASYGTEYRYVAPWSKWLRWDGKRLREDSTLRVFDCIRGMVRVRVAGTKQERGTASAGFVTGVERLAHVDQRIAVLPEQLDADPWLLNTQSGIVDLRTGAIHPHDPARLCTRITNAAVDPNHGRELWAEFLRGVTQGDADLEAYLQRVAGYCATGATTEDVLVYLFGIGANGKSSFAEAIAYALGDYAKVFPSEVLMESKGERHPTDLAQFMGVRFAVTSEPASSATWNDSRIKHLTGDAMISARFMRGDFFEFPRTHKTVVVGNHMPRLSDVTHAIRRRVQMVPFRAVFEPVPGKGMRERLKEEAGGAILAWIVAGARSWAKAGTAPPLSVTELTADYLSDQDVFGQWLAARCRREPQASALSSDLYMDYLEWCRGQGDRFAKSNKALSMYLVSAGFKKEAARVGKQFRGLALVDPGGFAAVVPDDAEDLL